MLLKCPAVIAGLQYWPPALPRMNPPSPYSITAFYPTGVIVMFSLFNSSQSAFVDNQVDRFQSQQFSDLCISFLSV